MMIKRNKKIYIVGMLIVISSISGVTYSNYISNLGEETQIINAKKWNVDSSVEYEDVDVDKTIFKDFKPGITKNNVIKLENENDYQTKFYLEIKTSGELFKNDKINLSLSKISNKDNINQESLQWVKTENNENAKSYFYEVVVEDEKKAFLNLAILWDDSDEHAHNYINTQGDISYSFVAEAVNENTK